MSTSLRLVQPTPHTRKLCDTSVSRCGRCNSDQLPSSNQYLVVVVVVVMMILVA